MDSFGGRHSACCIFIVLSYHRRYIIYSISILVQRVSFECVLPMHSFIVKVVSK